MFVIKRTVSNRVVRINPSKKTFEETNFTLRYILGPIEIGLRSLGIWPMKSRFSIWNFIICSLSLIAGGAACFCGMMVTTDLETFIDCLLYVLVSFATLLKVLIVRYKRKDFELVLNFIASDCSQYLFLSARMKKRIRKNVRTLKYISLILLTCLGVSATAFVLQTYDPTTKNLAMFKSLPFLVCIPSWVLHSSLFYMILLLLFGFGWVWATSVVTVDCTFAIFMMHAANQFIIVSEALKLIDEKRIISPCNKREPSLRCMCIKCIIKKHINVLRFIQQVQSMVGALLLVEITRNILHFGIQINNFLWLYDINSVIKLAHVVIILFSMNLHLLLYCSAASFMTDAGKQISTSAFSMTWFNYRTEIIRDITFMILRAQNPCYVTVAKTILKTSVSYASVILAARKS